MSTIRIRMPTLKWAVFFFAGRCRVMGTQAGVIMTPIPHARCTAPALVLPSYRGVTLINQLELIVIIG